MKHIALYARVSTTDQNPDAQLDPLRAYAAARGAEAVFEHVDHGVSGRRDRRPALDALLRQAHRREVDAVCIVKLDRLARSVRHLTQVAAELDALGVALVVLDQSIDTSTPSGRFLLHTLGAVAELEADLIRERTRAGIAAARRRGKVPGRARALDAEKSKRLARMIGAGQSQAHVARILGVGKATVNREVARLGLRCTG